MGIGKEFLQVNDRYKKTPDKSRTTITEEWTISFQDSFLEPDQWDRIISQSADIYTVAEKKRILLLQLITEL